MRLQSIEQTLESRQSGLLGYHEARKTAVLVTLQPDDKGDMQILFELRAKTLRRQPGEISFPGGHVESTDAGPAATAVREAAEELGVSESSIRLLGALDVFPASSNLLVYPYVGFIAEGVKLHPNPHEVEEVFQLPYEQLLNYQPDVYELTLRPEFPDDFPYHLVPQGRNYSWRTSTQRQYFFQFDDWVIWGLTARILKHFLDLTR
ncbi:CoA pyrophosphatase [Alicyclobacillus curvatus]|nr:CoA pyrophosphatase [Alicyclobacillus curvatus]